MRSGEVDVDDVDVDDAGRNLNPKTLPDIAVLGFICCYKLAGFRV